MTFPHAVERGRLQGLFQRWDHREIQYVRKAVHGARRPLIRKFFLLISTLSNGWLYAGIAVLILVSQGLSSWPLLMCAGLATLICHCIYPLIKKRLARIRPCDYDSSINLSVKVLDAYSCPSGHVMTAVSVGIPMAFSMPSLIPEIIGACLLISWSRLSLGHHYPSDLVLGGLLGSLISLPMSIALI